MIDRRQFVGATMMSGLGAAAPAALAATSPESAQKAAAVDLTGGMSDTFDLMAPEEQNSGPMYRESVSMWLYDDSGAIQFPRFLIEDVRQDPTRRLVFFNIAFPNGRALVEWGHAPPVPMLDANGRPTIYGVEDATFHCVEPFKTWRFRLHRKLTETTNLALMHGAPSGPLVDVDLEIEVTCVAPPWVLGESTLARGQKLEGVDAVATGLGRGFKYEQLVLLRGRADVGGVRHDFTGRGLRIHRRNSRDSAGFRGHVWQSAVFPSGKGFGIKHLNPPADGGPFFSEAYFFDGKTMHDADVVAAPYFTEAKTGRQAVNLTIRAAGRDITILGETYAGNFSTQRAADRGADPLLQQQACVRYSLDGEEAFGMMERSNFRKNIRFPD